MFSARLRVLIVWRVCSGIFADFDSVSYGFSSQYWYSFYAVLSYTTAASLPVFRRKLKTHLFRQSYPDIIL